MIAEDGMVCVHPTPEFFPSYIPTRAWLSVYQHWEVEDKQLQDNATASNILHLRNQAEQVEKDDSCITVTFEEGLKAKMEKFLVDRAVSNISGNPFCVQKEMG